MARPNPPGVSSTPSGRGFLFLFQTLRGAGVTRSIYFKRRGKKLREAPEVRDDRGVKASADGARRAKYGNNLRVGSREQDVAQTGQSGAGLARSLGCRPESGASPRLALGNPSLDKIEDVLRRQQDHLRNLHAAPCASRPVAAEDLLADASST